MRMHTDPGKPLPAARVALVAAMTVLLSGWTTCTVMGALDALDVCNSSIPQPEIISLSPSSIPLATESTVLKVNGSNFTGQSQIQWNGNGVPTTLVNSSLLEATITQQTIAIFGATADSTVQISVNTRSVASAGCLSSSSAVLLLEIE